MSPRPRGFLPSIRTGGTKTNALPCVRESKGMRRLNDRGKDTGHGLRLGVAGARRGLLLSRRRRTRVDCRVRSGSRCSQGPALWPTGRSLHLRPDPLEFENVLVLSRQTAGSWKNLWSQFETLKEEWPMSRAPEIGSGQQIPRLLFRFPVSGKDPSPQQSEVNEYDC